MSNRLRSRPVLDVDLDSDAKPDEPLPVYRAMRDAGPAAWLPEHRLWAIGRHRDIKPVKPVPAVDVCTSRQEMPS